MKTAVALAPPPGWAALIEAMLDAVWLVDPRTLAIVAANARAGRLLDMDPRDLVGKTMSELRSAPEDLFFWTDAVRGLADEIESQTLIVRADGSVLPVLRRISRVVSGSETLFVVALQDRSEPVRIERALEVAAAELRATLESTQDGILVTDLSGRIRNVNRRFAALWDIPDPLMQRRDDDAVLEWMRRSVVDPQAYMRRLATLDDATMVRATDELRLHAGTVLERVTVPQCMQGRAIGRVYSFRDITARRETAH